MQVLREFWRDVSPPAAVAGAVAVLVAFASTTALVYQAAQALGATPAQLTSWLWALGMGCAVVALLPSLVLRQPVMPGWSVPGAVVIATAGASGGYSMAEGVGAFLICAALIVLVGVTGWFERVMNRIPLALANALLAGVLARFALEGFGAARQAPALVVLMLLAYVLARRWLPRHAVILTLLAGTAWAAATGQMQWPQLQFELARPVWVAPAFSFSAFVSLALPMFVVTMASQNLPGVAVMRSFGYVMPVSRLISFTGIVTLALAPFGGYAINLSTVTAAICMGPEAHEDPRRRYTAAVVCGLMYALVASFAGLIAGVLLAFPPALVLVIAGLALLGPIGGALAQSMQAQGQREAALITFLVTLSGVVVAGVGSAFWGVLAGALALFVQQYGTRQKPPVPP